MTAQTYIRRGKQRLFLYAAQLGKNRLFHSFLWGGGGFLSAAASIGNLPQPLNMGLICAARGGDALAAAAGSAGGFRVCADLCGHWRLLRFLCFSPPEKKRKNGRCFPRLWARWLWQREGLCFCFWNRNDCPFLCFCSAAQGPQDRSGCCPGRCGEKIRYCAGWQRGPPCWLWFRWHPCRG